MIEKAVDTLLTRIFSPSGVGATNRNQHHDGRLGSLDSFQKIVLGITIVSAHRTFEVLPEHRACQLPKYESMHRRTSYKALTKLHVTVSSTATNYSVDEESVLNVLNLAAL